MNSHDSTKESLPYIREGYQLTIPPEKDHLSAVDYTKDHIPTDWEKSSFEEIYASKDDEHRPSTIVLLYKRNDVGANLSDRYNIAILSLTERQDFDFYTVTTVELDIEREHAAVLSHFNSDVSIDPISYDSISNAFMNADFRMARLPCRNLERGLTIQLKNMVRGTEPNDVLSNHPYWASRLIETLEMPVPEDAPYKHYCAVYHFRNNRSGLIDYTLVFFDYSDFNHGYRFDKIIRNVTPEYLSVHTNGYARQGA